MTDLRHSLRVPGIAIAALVGMLSVVSDASASGTSATPRKGIPACCLNRACTLCCCKPASASARREPAAPPATLAPNRADLANSPTLPCGCRANDPAAPAPRPQLSSGNPSSDQDRGDSLGLAPEFTSAHAFVRDMRHVPSPSKSPLYLRHARLLI